MHFHRPFYEAAAQVLPVLLLVIAVGEIRWRAEGEGKHFFLPLFAVGAMVLGELFSLAVLAGGDDSIVEASVVAVGIGLGCLHLLIEYAALLIEEFIDRPESSDRDAALIYVAYGFVLAVVLGGTFFLYFQ